MSTAAATKLARLEPLEPEPAAGPNLAQLQHYQHIQAHHHQLQPPAQEAAVVARELPHTRAARHMNQQLVDAPATQGPFDLNQQQFAPKSAHPHPLQQAAQHTSSQVAQPSVTNAAPVAKKRGRRRQQSQPEQANGLDHVFLWDIDGSLVRSGTIADPGEPLEPSVLASVNDKLNQLAKRLKELALNFCDEHLYLSELETVDQMHIDDVPTADHNNHINSSSTTTGPTPNGAQSFGPNRVPSVQAVGAQQPPEAASQSLAVPATHNQDIKPQPMQDFTNNNNKLVLMPLVHQTCVDTNNNQLFNSSHLAEPLEQPYEHFEPIYDHHHQHPHHHHQLNRTASEQLEYATQEQLYTINGDSNQQHHQNSSHLHLNHHHHQQHQHQANTQADSLDHYHQHHQPHHHHHHHHLSNQQLQSQMLHQSPPNSLHNYLQHRHFQQQSTTADSLNQSQEQFQTIYDNFSTSHAPQTFQQAALDPSAGTHYYQPPAGDCERTYLLEPIGDPHYYSHHPYHHHSHHQHHTHSHQHTTQEQIPSNSLVSQYMTHESSGTGSDSGYGNSGTGGVTQASTGYQQAANDQSFSQLAMLQAGQQAYTPGPESDASTGTGDQLWLTSQESSPHSTHLHNFQVNQSHHNQHQQLSYSSASLPDSSEPPLQHAQFHQPNHQHQHHLHQPQQELLQMPAIPIVQHHLATLEPSNQQPLLSSIGCEAPLRANPEQKALIEPATCQFEADLDHSAPHHLCQHHGSICDQLPHDHDQHHLLQSQPQPHRQSASDGDQQANALRTVISNQHKQMTHKLSMRFHRIKAVYNLNRNTGNASPGAGGLFKGNEQMAQDLNEILTEIDHYTLDWRKRAMDCLRLIAESPNCTNIIITKLPLIVAFGHLVCLDLAQFFDIDQVYSASKTSKETCIARIKKRFGATNRCSYIIVGPKDKENVDVSERLDLPVWPTTKSDGHRQLANLMRALREGLLM